MPKPIPLLSSLAVLAPLVAQRQPEITAEDYAHAETFLSATTGKLVSGMISRPTWLPNGLLLYRNSIPAGTEIVIADPERRTRTRAFDHVKLAKALSEASGSTRDPFDLPGQFELSDDARSVTFTIGRRAFACDLETYRCVEKPRTARNVVESPDGKLAAFIRDHDLWVRDTATGEETRLTTDGVKDFGYATNNAGWTKSDGPVLLWSPDSTKIATFQHDGRKVGEMYLVSTEVGHSELQAWKYPLPGDEHIFMIHRVVIDVPARRVVRLKLPPDAHRSTTTDHIAGRGGRFLDVEWSQDGRQLVFISSSRDHKQAQLRVADPDTGEVRDVLGEVVDTYFESGDDYANWRALPESGEVIWFSERDDWGHLYLYDLRTGKLKNAITSGEWAVQQLRHIDRETRTLYFTAAGREPGDPYFRYFYRVKLDGTDLELLTPERAHHTVTLSPSGDFFVDSYSTPVEPPVAVVRRANGEKCLTLAKADISRLVATGWRPPTPFVVKARDAKTDLHGLLYKPTRFDPRRRYPILNYLYPGPQSGSVGSRSFSPSRRDKQAIAELGFVVVEVDAMGTPGRSKSFHDAYYGNMGDNGLPDQIATIKQLAGRHPWMDLDRVGIWGHSVDAILRYPDFYKVAVSGAGNHDNRNYEDDWGEKWQGLLTKNDDGTTNYDNQANQLLAKNLKGKLLLAHGLMDSNVPPTNTLLVVQALIEANKDFDLIVFPEAGHGFGNSPYMMRRRWDYFVRHLLGVEPPKEFEFKRNTARR